MTIQQLIDLLSNEQNKDRPVVLQCSISSMDMMDMIKVTSFQKMDLSTFEINDEDDEQLIEQVKKDWDEEKEFIISFMID